MTFSDSILPSTEAETDSPGQSISFAVNGEYHFQLPSEQSLTADWSFSHSDNRQRYSYTLGDLDPIRNRQNEMACTPSATVTYSKSLGHDNTLRTMVSSYADFYDTHYTGSYMGTQRLVSSESMLFLEYLQNWGFGMSLYSRLGASYVLGRVNGENRIHQWSPRLGLSLQQQINSKNSVSLEAWWANSHPQASTSNSAFMQVNELMWIQGNPDLRNVYGPMLSANYNWIPTNRLSLTASVKYENYRHMPVYYYYTLPSYNGVVRTFSDDNTVKLFSASVAGSLRLLDNSLMLRGVGSLKRSAANGIHPMSLTWLNAVLTAAYFYRNVSFLLYYGTPTRDIFNKNGNMVKGGSAYMLMATYTLGNFKASFNFRHWFSDGKYYTTYGSPHYSLDSWRYESGRHRNIDLTLAYTIPYGKRVDRKEDLQNKAIRQSAILE